jgi:hypothetical protein
MKSLRQSRRDFLAGTLVIGTSVVLPDVGVDKAKAPRRPIVLVHGAWSGGWCWRRVVDRLTAKGYYVTAPTLSGVGERSHLNPDTIDLTTQINDIVNEVKWKDLDGITLVGHSFGGIVITGATEKIRERIAAIVYVDAFIPLDGESMSSLRNNAGSPLPVPTVPSPPAAYFKVNAADVDWVNSKATAHPTKAFTEPVHVTDAYQRIPKKVYIRAPAFKQTAFDTAYARCRGDSSWKTYELPCGHAVMIDMPAELTEIIESVG